MALEIKCTGRGAEAGTDATWHWYNVMDVALQGQHSISLPLVVAVNLIQLPGQEARSAHWPD